jgi:hypothetical protein
MGYDEHVVALWREAARDLRIAAVSPFSALGPRGESALALVWLKDFGSPRGALVCTVDDPDDLATHALEWGYEVVTHSPFAYPEHYERRLFMQILDELGWSGTHGDRPPWVDALGWR